MKEETAVRVLTVDEWCGLAQEGADLPVRFTVSGVSMQPLIRRERDHVTVVPLKRPPLVGDVVLFRSAAGTRFVLHRVRETDDAQTQTWGDNCLLPDERIPTENVLGLAVRLERGSKTVELDSDRARKRGLRLAKINHAALRFRRRLSLTKKWLFG